MLNENNQGNAKRTEDDENAIAIYIHTNLYMYMYSGNSNDDESTGNGQRKILLNNPEGNLLQLSPSLLFAAVLILHILEIL